MCTASSCDLEEIPLDDDDTNSIEFKILAFYTKHHVFKNTPAIFSQKLLRTRSLSIKEQGGWSANESWTQVSWPCRNSPSREKPLDLAKKKSSWRTFFGVIEKEEDAQSSEVFVSEGATVKHQDGPQSQQWSRSLTNVGPRTEQEGRLWGPLLSHRKIFPFLVCVVFHLLPAGNVA